MGEIKRRPILLVVGIVAAGLLTPIATAGAASANEPLHLVPPTGPHRVGATQLYLKDTSRHDP